MDSNEGSREFPGLGRALLDYVNHKSYMLALALTALGSYGFLVTHYSVSIDDLTAGRYLSGELFAQGRLTATLLNPFFRTLGQNYCYLDLIGVLALCLSAVIMCVVLDRCVVTQSKAPQTVFSCLFVSYPLYSEIFGYTGMSVAVGAGCALVALGVLAAMRFAQRKRWRDLAASVACLLPPSSWYESVLLVYVGLVFAVLLLRQLAHGKEPLRKTLRQGLLYALPLLIAVALEAAASWAVLRYYALTPSTMGANGIYWNLSSYEAFCAQLGTFWKYVKQDLLLKAPWYLPIGTYLCAVFAALVLLVIHSVRKRSLSIALCYFGLIVSTQLLSLIQCDLMPYRASQIYGFFIAFLGFLAVAGGAESNERTPKRRRRYRVVCTLLALLTVYQVCDIAHWFELDHLRYTEERRVVEDIGEQLASQYDLTKPVLFTGIYRCGRFVLDRTQMTVSNDLRLVRLVRAAPVLKEISAGIRDLDTYFVRFQQTNAHSCINWGMNAFGEVNTELLHFFEFCGFDGIRAGTREQYESAMEEAKNMAAWPKQGSIKDAGEYIIVHFGF